MKTLFVVLLVLIVLAACENKPQSQTPPHSPAVVWAVFEDVHSMGTGFWAVGGSEKTVLLENRLGGCAHLLKRITELASHNGFDHKRDFVVVRNKGFPVMDAKYYGTALDLDHLSSACELFTFSGKWVGCTAAGNCSIDHRVRWLCGSDDTMRCNSVIAWPDVYGTQR